MAKNGSDNGKGSSKIAETPEQQNATRRATKAKRRGTKGLAAAGNLFADIDADKRERREQNARHAFCAVCWSHIARTAAKRGWSETMIDEAHAYLSSLVLDNEVFNPTFGVVEQEVRWRFALSCHLRDRTPGMPGQRQEWFAAELNRAQEFWAARKTTPQRQLQPA